MSRSTKRKHNFMNSAKAQMTDTFCLPKELINGDSMMTLRGQNELFIENYRGILECTDTFIRIATKHFRLQIKGCNLSVSYYTNDEMKVIGTIEQISFVE